MGPGFRRSEREAVRRRLASALLALLAPLSIAAAQLARAPSGQPDQTPDTLEERQRLADQLLAPMRSAFAREDIAEAMRTADLIIEDADAQYGPDNRLSVALAEFMFESLRQRGRYREAELYLRRILADRERHHGPDGDETLDYLELLATQLLALQRYSEAEPLFVRLLEASERTAGPASVQTQAALVGLGTLYRLQARYGEAEQTYLRALAIEGDRRTRSAAARELAALLVNQRRAAEAEALYLNQLRELESSEGPDHPDTLDVVVSLGRLRGLQERVAEAESLLRRGVQGLERTVGPEHPDTLAALYRLATVLGGQRRYAEAEALLLRLVPALERVLGPTHWLTSEAMTELAYIYYMDDRYPEAEPLLSRALAMRTATLGPDHPQTIRSALGVALVRLQLGGGSEALGPARQAVLAMRARLSRLPAATAGEAQFDRERSWNNEHFTIFADAAWTSAATRQELTNEVFLALQDAANSTAGQAVARMAIRQLADRAGRELNLGRLIRERDELIAQWTSNGEQVARAVAAEDSTTASPAVQLRTERDRIEARLAEIDALLRRHLPQFFTLVRPEAIPLREAQALLAPDEAILLIVPAGMGTHVVAVSATDAGWVRSDWDWDRIDESVRRLLWDVGASVQIDAAESAEWERQGGSGYPFDRTTAHNLYRHLVEPVRTVLAGKRHVFTATAGSLTSLPLGILVTEPPQGADGDPAALRATHWFADAHALTQIPSVQSLLFLRRFAREPHGDEGAMSFMGFGDPLLQGQAVSRGRLRGRRAAAPDAIFAASLDRDGRAAINLSQLRLLSRLPGTAIELQNMREALRAPADSLFLGERATETNVRTANLRGARILAFATHGLLAGNLSETREPGLVFTPPAQPSDTDNGYLSSSEIAGLQLDADWIILSACDTASGDGSEGAPGLSGLARAFFYAGARNLLASHWPLRDDIASILTVRTIQLQAERPGLSRAEALQLAMREIRNDTSHDSADDTWAHPNAWAAFSLIGDGAR